MNAPNDNAAPKGLREWWLPAAQNVPVVSVVPGARGGNFLGGYWYTTIARSAPPRT